MKKVSRLKKLRIRFGIFMNVLTLIFLLIPLVLIPDEDYESSPDW